MKNFNTIKNLVFDLGGVIINLDFDKTYSHFAELAGLSTDALIDLFKKEAFFLRYETGQMLEDEFIELLKSKISTNASTQEIKIAWNALLLDIPEQRIRLIESLRGKYNLYLLSNTNFTHIEEVNNILYLSSGVKDLRDLFDKVYYSYEIKLAKPERSIYDFVCADAGILPGETIFLDDSLPNISGAELAGWNTIHVNHPATILELLKNA